MSRDAARESRDRASQGAAPAARAGASAWTSAAPSPIWSGSTPAGRLSVAKALTSRDYAGGVLACLEQADVPPATVGQSIHGSTIAINTVLQRQGALTALVTTAGFRDVYEMGRGGRYQSYNLAYRRPPPLVPRHRRLEVPERVAPDGERGAAAGPRGGARAPSARWARSAWRRWPSACSRLRQPGHELALGELLAEELPGLTWCSRTACCGSSASTSARRRRSSTPTWVRPWGAIWGACASS